MKLMTVAISVGVVMGLVSMNTFATQRLGTVCKEKDCHTVASSVTNPGKTPPAPCKRWSSDKRW